MYRARLNLRPTAYAYVAMSWSQRMSSLEVAVMVLWFLFVGCLTLLGCCFFLVERLRGAHNVHLLEVPDDTQHPAQL